jgi:hypothetical protein
MISPAPSQNVTGNTVSPEGELLPHRNPGLVQRIATAIFRSNPTIGPQAADKEGTSTGIQSEPGIMSSIFDRQFKIDVNRRALYREVDEMDNASEEASIALDIIANNVTTSEDGVQMSFDIKADDDTVQEIFDKAIRVCKLNQQILPMARNLVKYGDSFSEPVVNMSAEISELKQLPPSTMHRNQTPGGALLMGAPRYEEGKCINRHNECAFEQRIIETDDIIATFYPWQVIHIRLNNDGFSPYGKSHLRVSRGTFKKLTAIEQSLVVGRLTREYLKLIFYIDTTGLSKTQKKVALTEFKHNVTQRINVDGRRDSPFSVMTDFFISTGWIKIGSQVQPSKASVDVLDPKNVGIHEITDVEYLHRKFIATLRVPPAHLGFEKDINAKATLTLQDTQFIRFIRSVQQQLGQGLEQFFDILLVINGYDPETTNYVISWPELSATDQMNAAQSELWRAQSDQLYLMGKVISPTWIQEHRFDMTPEEIAEVNAENEKIAAQQQELAQQQAQAQQGVQDQQAEGDHERNLELVKAKAQANGFNKNGQNPGRVNSHKGGNNSDG